MLPWWSDLATSRQCVIKLLHVVRIRVLILGSTSGVLIRACQTMSASFHTSFYLTLLQDSFFIFQQARGLSGHTSPCGECACSHLEATPGDWLPARLVFYFLALAPHDYVTYYQAQGLAVGVCPPGILMTRHGPHHQRWPNPQDQDVHRKAIIRHCIIPNRILSL